VTTLEYATIRSTHAAVRALRPSAFFAGLLAGAEPRQLAAAGRLAVAVHRR
jgi:hypothetical protein